jgi:hypothetical protein
MKEVFSVASIDMRTGEITSVAPQTFDTYQAAQVWIEDAPYGAWQIQKIFVKA